MRVFILFSLIIIFILGITFQENPIAANKAANNSFHLYCDNFVYVRVEINGVWWIYVYTQEGSLVDIYPDYEN